jgi:tRNA-splicing ligase RtcB
MSLPNLTIFTDKPYRIFAEVLEPAALAQFESAMQQEFVVQGALMPDAHAGYSLPIGAVVATRDFVVPAWVGYDIGCGMCAMRTNFDPDDVREYAKEIFDAIYAAVPVGFNHNRVPTEWPEAFYYPVSPTTEQIYAKNGRYQLGSLGSGNHFAEVGEDESGYVWVIVHSGSRGIGHAVAKHYMTLASPDGKPSEGHWGFWADSEHGKDYIKDMKFCLEFALKNRSEMLQRIERCIAKFCAGEGTSVLINRNHNHAEKRESDGLWIHRKGATHAEAGMFGVIPGNMRDGSFIVCGKGNPDSLCSSSHGAGRVMGRKEAQRTLTMEAFQEAMAGLTAMVTKDTLDESPFAYKDIFDVMRQQSELVEVVAHVRPIINIKG